MLTGLPDFNHSAGIFHTGHLHQETFFPSLFLLLSLLIIVIIPLFVSSRPYSCLKIQEMFLCLCALKNSVEVENNAGGVLPGRRTYCSLPENPPTFGCLVVPILWRPDRNNKEPAWCQATGNKSSTGGQEGVWKVGRQKKKKKKSIWRGLGLTSQRLGPGVGSGGDAELLGKEWEAPGNGALSGQRDRDKKVAFQNGKMLR